MKNYVFGYARVSTKSQNLDRQLDALEKYGVDHIYNEKMTGTKKDRPELIKMLDRILKSIECFRVVFIHMTIIAHDANHCITKLS